MANCVDSDQKCSLWASQGECQSNAIWMMSNCRRSCQSCQGGDKAWQLRNFLSKNYDNSTSNNITKVALNNDHYVCVCAFYGIQECPDWKCQDFAYGGTGRQGAGTCLWTNGTVMERLESCLGQRNVGGFVAKLLLDPNMDTPIAPDQCVQILFDTIKA
jgi:hypothetical protein